MLRSFGVALLGATFFLFGTEKSQAVPFTTDLAISGSAEFDTGFANVDGTVTQTGSFGRVVGGVATNSTFSGTAVNSGVNPVLGTLTDIGDGFGAIADISASGISDYRMAIDFDFDLQNNSATDTFQVTFKVNFSNAVNASGDDSFADSEFEIDTPPFTEVFFSDLESDTRFGNEINGINIPGFGGLVSDSGMSFFNIVLAPSDTQSIAGQLVLDGGVFETPGTSIIDFDGFISVFDVENLTPPPPPVGVPEPAGLLLFGLGLMGLAAIRRRRTNHI